MRIGIIAHLKHPIIAPFAGGLEVFTYEITRRLVARGHDVILFASSNSDENLPVDPILSDEGYDHKTGMRIKLKDLPSEYIAEHHAYFGLMTRIDDYNLDIIFNNSLHYIPITMANTLRTPMLTVLHTPPFYELQLAIKAERKNPVIQYVTVSNQSAINWDKIVSNCEVIENGIDLNQWKSGGGTSKQQYAVWFGRIHPDKGLHLAIQAAKIAGIPLKVAGGIADQRYFNEKVSELLDENVELLGIQDQKSLNALICGASVCIVSPCWQEPFGLVVAEALSCGTPVAGFKMGALPEIVAEEAGILVDFPNVDDLAEAIKSCLKLDRKVVSDYARGRFDIEKMMDKYEDMLSEVAQRKTHKDFLKI
ncbi:glycosyltransferase [Pedobacter sp. CFBP9032]|uniref:glycosyltransferase n=1 Tax=Pedobacter sp. CFBP9032 TaxID=3096539 RepID=UPI002A6A7D58|nr:glycosyltransferase [Pedobacter sp. CFBP9032]MDY0904960.1 glycosyltransferase [Pedobacter sp. CFBP9032]